MAVTLLAAALAMSFGTSQAVQAPLSVPGDSARAERLQAWRTAVEQHRPGVRDRATVEIATWPEGHLITVVRDLEQVSRFLVRGHTRLRQSGRVSTFSFERRPLSMAEAQQMLGLNDDEARRGDLSRLALQGALLHTDIATLLEENRARGAPGAPALSSRRNAVLVLDGQEYGAMDRGPHWEIGRALVDLLPADALTGEAVRRWYVATAAFMQSRSLLSDMQPHIARALERFPADPDILFYAGSMHETCASPLIQAAISDIRLRPGEKLAVGSAQTHLERARRSFERAVDANPHRLEGRLRLGRTLLALGRYEAGAEQLRHALDHSTDRLLEYYAALLLGEAEAALGRNDRAWQAFERAAALYPSAQSPYLTMSRLAYTDRTRRETVTALLRVLGLPGEDPARFDPWWMYFAAPEEEADRLLAEWSASIDTREGS